MANTGAEVTQAGGFRTGCWINCWMGRTRLRRFKAAIWSRN